MLYLYRQLGESLHFHARSIGLFVSVAEWVQHCQGFDDLVVHRDPWEEVGITTLRGIDLAWGFLFCCVDRPLDIGQ